MSPWLFIYILVVSSALVIASPNSEKDMKGPVFIKEPENRIDFSNSTGTVVECRANASPPPEIIWVRSDGTAVGDVPGLRQVLPNGNLVFPPFRAEDYRQEVHAQIYACLAKNQVGSIISRDVHVRAGELKFPTNADIVDADCVILETLIRTHLTQIFINKWRLRKNKIMILKIKSSMKSCCTTIRH